ncbi:MAG: DUF6133 family protein [Acidimicrobiales bacterium]
MARFDDLTARVSAAAAATAVNLRSKLAEDRGEGVISGAIAVLIMAAIGALAYGGYKLFWDTIQAETSNQVNQIAGPR